MHIPIEAAKKILGQQDSRFVSLFAHGSLSIELYAPVDHDHQTPHSRDEVYIIVSGIGKFQLADLVVDFEPHDFLFVPAGVDHRFIEFTDDFSTWVLFYGPEGGE